MEEREREESVCASLHSLIARADCLVLNMKKWNNEREKNRREWQGGIGGIKRWMKEREEEREEREGASVSETPAGGGEKRNIEQSENERKLNGEREDEEERRKCEKKEEYRERGDCVSLPDKERVEGVFRFIRVSPFIYFPSIFFTFSFY